MPLLVLLKLQFHSSKNSDVQETLLQLYTSYPQPDETSEFYYVKNNVIPSQGDLQRVAK